jgi:tetratricopeptide (TPR) repeat protein
MKPETKKTLAQAGAMILLLGLLLWLVVVGLQAIVEVSTGSGQSSNVEGSPAGGAASGQRTAPTDGTPEGDRAARLSRDGKNMMAAGDYKGAESAFLQAIELAPSVSAHYTNLASLYENIALDSTTYVAQSQYHQAAGEQWAAATVREADQQAAAAYRQGAANAYYRSALAEANLGNRARALALLTKADTYAAPNTEAARMISELRSGLNG